MNHYISTSSVVQTRKQLSLLYLIVEFFCRFVKSIAHYIIIIEFEQGYSVESHNMACY